MKWFFKSAFNTCFAQCRKSSGYRGEGGETSLPARTSWKYSQPSCFDESRLAKSLPRCKNFYPRNARSAAASAHPRLATSSGGSALICRRANILRCVQVNARLASRFLQMRLRWLWVFTTTRCPALPWRLREAQKKNKIKVQQQPLPRNKPVSAEWETACSKMP